MTESEYKDFLDVVTKEIEHAAFTFHTYQTIFKIIADTPEILETVNLNPLFWRTQTFSLQVAFFLALRRVFDDAPEAYSIYRFISITRKNPKFFTKSALEQRRCIGKSRPIWMDEFLAQSFELNVEELNNVHASLSTHKDKWTRIYLPICDSMFAHSLQNQEDIMANKLRQTNMADLEAMVLHLRNVMYGFEDLYINGDHLQLGSRALWDKEKIEENTRSLLETLTNGYQFQQHSHGQRFMKEQESGQLINHSTHNQIEQWRSVDPSSRTVEFGGLNNGWYCRLEDGTMFGQSIGQSSLEQAFKEAYAQLSPSEIEFQAL